MKQRPRTPYRCTYCNRYQPSNPYGYHYPYQFTMEQPQSTMAQPLSFMAQPQSTMAQPQFNMAQPQYFNTQNPTISAFNCQFCKRYQPVPACNAFGPFNDQPHHLNPPLQTEKRVKRTIMIIDPNTRRDLTYEILKKNCTETTSTTSPLPNDHSSESKGTTNTKQSELHIECSNERRQRVPLLPRCTICKEKLRDPISFLCFHSICKKCFEGIVRQQQTGNCKNMGDIWLKCPSCCYQTSLDVLQLNKYERNHFYVQQFIQTLCDIEYGMNTSFCISCKRRGKKTTSSFWCFDCVDHYCDECLALHSSFPQLDKHKTYSLDEVRKKPSLLCKAREICEKHKSRFTKFCVGQEKVCCDSCISSDHMNICLSDHIEVQQITVSMIVDPKVSELKKSIQEMYHEIMTKETELADIEIKAEKFFKKEQFRADETSNILKKKMLQSTDLFLAESFKASIYNLEERQTRRTMLNQQKVILENAYDVMSALRGGSDIRVFLETKKVIKVLKNAKALLHTNEEAIKTISISFKRTFNRFCRLNSFGNIMEIQLISNPDKSALVRKSQKSSIARHKAFFQ